MTKRRNDINSGETDNFKQKFSQAKQDYEDIGGWQSLKSGEFLWLIIKKSFDSYWKNANAEYFQSKYGTQDPKILSKKLISVTARNAALLGGATGVAMSADEIAALTTVGGGGLSLPANIALGAVAIGGEVILLTRFHLQLVANLGKVKGVPLDPDDPEDILTILAFAVGGVGAEAAGKFGMKIGGKLAGNAVKGIVKKEILEALKRISAKVGIRLLQRSLIKYTVPVASVIFGLGWNYASTKAVGRIAIKHFEKRITEIKKTSRSSSNATGRRVRIKSKKTKKPSAKDDRNPMKYPSG